MRFEDRKAKKLFKGALSKNPHYVPALVAMGAAALVMLAMPPGAGPQRHSHAPDAHAAGESLAGLLRLPAIALGLSAMFAGQVSMVLVMTMTPVHMRHEGAGLGAIGLVIAAHTLGMYALSPLTGLVVDRVNPRRVIAAGTALLVAACGLAALARGHGGLLLAALALLGVGWNFDFVAGSALLAGGASSAARMRVQGVGDALVWSSGAMAGFASGLVLHATGFLALSVAGAAVALLPVAWLVRRPIRP